MADILFPDSTPQGAAATFGTPAAPTPDTTSPAPDQPQSKGKKDGGKKGGLGGFLTSPLGEIIGGVAAAGLGALTGGLAFPALGIGTAALGAGLGGALGGGLEQGIVNKSPVAGLLGAVEGAGVGLGGEALAAGALPALGLTAAGAPATAAVGGAGSAAAGAAPAGAGAVAAPLTSAAGAADPLAGLLSGAGAAGGAGGAGGAGSAALAPAAFGAASDPTAAALGAVPAAGGGAPAAGGGGALSELLAGNFGGAAGDVGSWLASHPSLAMSAIGPIASLLSPTPKVPGMDALGRSAKDLERFGSSAITAESTGNLPPGAETFVENSLKDEEARIRGTYASLGLSGSTMEAQDLAAASERAAANRFQIASQVTSQGITALGGASSDFATLAQLQLAQDQRLQEAISSFSSALGYGQGLQRIPTA